MIVKIAIVCGIVVLFPFLYMLKVKLSQTVSVPQLCLSDLIKKRTANQTGSGKTTTIFEKLFEYHFAPDTGQYENQELRSLVHEIYGADVKSGKSYKQLWRLFSSRFSERSGDKKFTQSERKDLSEYFRRKFRHYNEVIAP